MGGSPRSARIEAAGGQMTIGPGDDVPGAAGPGTTIEVWLAETPGAADSNDGPNGGDARHRLGLHLHRGRSD